MGPGVQIPQPRPLCAGVAQLVEQLICNQQVAGSSPIASSTISLLFMIILYGRVPEWPKGADCKSVAFSFDGSNPSSSTTSPQASYRLRRLFYKSHRALILLRLLFRQKARSARLLGCKRPRDGSRSLPPFCECVCGAKYI